MSEERVQKFYRRKQLPEVTGYSVPHLYEMMRDGRFPKPIKISARSSAWAENDILKWQRQRIAASKADA